MFNVASNAKWPNSNTTLTFQVANRTEEKDKKSKDRLASGKCMVNREE